VAQKLRERRRVSGDEQVGADQPVYGITVAAGLVGSAPQNLRLYEARGLVRPHRTPGGTRLYSAGDLDHLRRIIRLLDDGLNLAGIATVIQLQEDNQSLRAQLDAERRRAKQRSRSGGPSR
jgi:MerR family transcriptional regulator, heat shock protein HspR